MRGGIDMTNKKTYNERLYTMGGKARLKDKASKGKAKRYRCDCTFLPDRPESFRRQYTASTAAEAERKRAEAIEQFEADYEAGKYGNVNDQGEKEMTLRQWADKWMMEYKGQRKESTWKTYAGTVDRYILPALGAYRLSEIMPDQINQFYINLLRGDKYTSAKDHLSAKSVKDVQGVLHKMLNQAVESRFLERNPAAGIDPPRDSDEPDEESAYFLDDDEILKFLRTCEGKPHELLYQFALYTGMRQEEILGLKWADCDNKNAAIHVRRQANKTQPHDSRTKGAFTTLKSNKCRSISVPDVVIGILQKQRRIVDENKERAGRLWVDNDLVFPNEAGEVQSYRTIYDCYKRRVDEIGLPQVRFHDLRHTYARLMLDSGCDFATLQKNLGHHSLDFTIKTYGHLSAKHLKGKATELNNYLSKNILHQNG